MNSVVTFIMLFLAAASAKPSRLRRSYHHTGWDSYPSSHSGWNSVGNSGWDSVGHSGWDSLGHSGWNSAPVYSSASYSAPLVSSSVHSSPAYSPHVLPAYTTTRVLPATDVLESTDVHRSSQTVLAVSVPVTHTYHVVQPRHEHSYRVYHHAPGKICAGHSVGGGW